MKCMTSFDNMHTALYIVYVVLIMWASFYFFRANQCIVSFTSVSYCG